MRKIEEIILHCSDSDVPSHDDISVIRKWHVEERGWSDVGYHFFIKTNGEVQEGRPLEKIGAHAYPRNSKSIGICLHGKEQFGVEQFRALSDLCCKLIFEFGIFTEDIIGHCEVKPSKTCPNFDVEAWKDQYL